MFSRRFLIALLALTIISMSSIPVVSLKFTGYLRNHIAPFINEGAAYTLIKDTFALDIEHAKEKIAFKGDFFVNHYPDKKLEFGMRQLYMNLYLGALDLRIGKQQIVWGKAEGVFITDIVSPRNLYEFLLPDFTEIRIGITALKANLALGANKSLEAVWAPAFTPVEMPDAGSPWMPPQTFPVQPAFDYSRTEVGTSLKNSEVFLKFASISSSLDFELMAGYMWDDDPSPHASAIIDTSTHAITNLVFSPRHHRLGVVGGSFSTTIGGLVFRGELACYMNKYFAANLLTTDGTLRKNYLHYLGAVDFSLGKFKFSVQFIQQAIFDYDERIRNNEFESMATFRLSTDFLRERLKMELFTYVGLNDGDALVRFKISYDIQDGLTLTLGTDLFFGDNGMFGQFDRNDMVYSKIKFSY